MFSGFESLVGFATNAVIAGQYCLRSCVVNFRTNEQVMRELVDITVKEGRRLALD